MTKLITGSLSALALVASPLAAAPAFAAPANPAASLSIAPSVRTGSATSHKNGLAGGAGILAAIIAAGVVAIGVVAITKDDNADSN